MRQYLDLLNHILDHGVEKSDRTGTGTRSVFGYQMRFDLSKGFPLLTTKKLHVRSIVHELLWFLSGSTNVRPLQENGVHIWDSWSDENGELGPVYGSQWRSWPKREGGTIDQISEVIERIKTKPDDRRLIVTAWNPEDIPKAALPPCHLLFQFWTRVLSGRERFEWFQSHLSMTEVSILDGSKGVTEETYLRWCHREIEWRPESAGAFDTNEDFFKYHKVPERALSCQLYQRSCDTFLGMPFNIASYALLTHLVAHVCGLAVGDFVWTGGDVHLYLNHLEQAKLQLTREPKNLPLVLLKDRKSIFDFQYEDVAFVGYDPGPSIKAPVSV